MAERRDSDGLVKYQSDNINRYTKNYLRQAVCELRFPTLMELGGARPPEAFVNALRKDYPYLEQQSEVRLSLGSAESGANNTHVFRSSKANWTVSLKESSVSLETTGYTTYAHLKDRLRKLLAAAALVIDSDFFTRVGLRYINVVDEIGDPASGWINPALVAPLSDGLFLGIQEYAGKIQLGAADGGCLLQHGLRLVTPKKGAAPQPEYMIDIDVFRMEVPLGEVEATLDVMHSQGFNLFDWSLGPKARAFLSGN